MACNSRPAVVCRLQMFKVVSFLQVREMHICGVGVEVLLIGLCYDFE